MILKFRWVLDTNRDGKENIVRHKVRLMANGFIQTKGYDS